MWKFLLLVIVPFNMLHSQEFTPKEEKRIKSILKRSSSSVRTLNKSSLISVEKLMNSEVEALVENALFSAGFQVVSNKVAKEAILISNPLSQSNENIEVSKKTTFKSVYVVTVACNIYEGSVIGRTCGGYLRSFTARIVDLSNEGKLVGVFKFSGSLECIEDVSNAFAYSIISLVNKN